MAATSFDVNNQRRIELVQTKHDGDVLMTVFDGDDYEEYTIDPGDFVMLLNHYCFCKHTGADIVQDDYREPGYWFGMVRWCDEDIKSALEYRCIEPDDEKILRVRHQLSHHNFTDAQIERGWDYIDGVVVELYPSY